jgi:hypothetical protein
MQSGLFLLGGLLKGGPQPDNRTTLISTKFYEGTRQITYVFSANLPTRFLSIQFFRNHITITSQSDNNVAFDRSQTGDLGCTCGASHWPNSYIEGGACWGSAVIGQLAMIEIAFEEHQI